MFIPLWLLIGTPVALALIGLIGYPILMISNFRAGR